MTPSDRKFFIEQNRLLPNERPPKLISEYVEGRRILPDDTPFPGAWRNAVTPYAVELMDNMSPFSPVRTMAVMKCRKVGLTTFMENVAAYWMDAMPTKILYATATEELAKEWSTGKIEKVIDTLGFRHKITANSYNPKSHRSGSNMRYKEFIGGRLDIVSSQSMEARRQKDIRVLLIDEVDAVEKLLSTGEGEWIKVLEGHTMSWGARKKIAYFSSPTTEDASVIGQLYKSGDCRKFIVPCPYCGRGIELKLEGETASWGLKPETKAGKLISVYYACEYCGEPIYNNQKKDFYAPHPRCLKHPEKKPEPCHWEPTKKAIDEFYRSYSINTLYSPIGMVSFEEVYKEKAEAEEKGVDGLRSWVNIYAGRPFQLDGKRPNIRKVLALRGAYDAGTVPAGALFLTMAVDVQQGSARDMTNPPRLELEVLGHGTGYRTWSVLYKIIEGETDDPGAGAWALLDQWAAGQGLGFPRADGVKLFPQLIFIDSGNAQDGRDECVFRFCENWTSTYPIKGFGYLVADPKRRERGDVPGAGSYKRWRVGKFGQNDNIVYEINTNYYKNTFYNHLRIQPSPETPNPTGLCSFPRNYDDEYFEQLCSEERLADGSFKRIRARNEALDTRVYALCAADVWLDSEVKAWRLYAEAKGWSKIQIAQINNKFILDYLVKNPYMTVPKI